MGDQITIGGEARARIRARKLHQPNAPSCCEINHIDIGIPRQIASVGEAAAIGAQAGRDAQSIVMGNLAEVRPVIISQIDFLEPRALADKGNRACGNPFVSAQGLHNVIDKLVRRTPSIARITFGKNDLPSFLHLSL